MNNATKIFCQEYVKNGNNGTQAYMKAHPKCTEETARRNASKLLTKTDVQQYIEKLQNKTEKKAIMSIEERMNWLTGIINSKECVSNRLKALEILNKMDGVYTQKLELQGNVRLNNPLRELTTEQLVEMINNEK